MKFLLDMGISPRAAEFLRDQGHEAAHLLDEGLERLPDSRIFVKARQEGRVIITHDLDFAELVAGSRAALPSVILFRLRDMRPANLECYLEVVLESHQEALARGAILSVTEKKIRARHLPLG